MNWGFYVKWRWMYKSNMHPITACRLVWSRAGLFNNLKHIAVQSEKANCSNFSWTRLHLKPNRKLFLEYTTRKNILAVSKKEKHTTKSQRDSQHPKMPYNYHVCSQTKTRTDQRLNTGIAILTSKNLYKIKFTNSEERYLCKSDKI